MRVLIDTNVFLAAILCPNGVAAEAYRLAFCDGNSVLVCDYVIEELKRVVHRKSSGKYDSQLTTFISGLMLAADAVLVPEEPVEGEVELRDPNDQPILRGALVSEADIILSGDKDLLEAGIPYPPVLTPRQFIDLLEKST